MFKGKRVAAISTESILIKKKFFSTSSKKKTAFFPQA